MELTFKATPDFESYHGKPGKWGDGETKEVPDEMAKELLCSFPRNFFKEKGITLKHNKSMKVKHDK